MPNNVFIINYVQSNLTSQPYLHQQQIGMSPQQPFQMAATAMPSGGSTTSAGAYKLGGVHPPIQNWGSAGHQVQGMMMQSNIQVGTSE